MKSIYFSFPLTLFVKIARHSYKNLFFFFLAKTILVQSPTETLQKTHADCAGTYLSCFFWRVFLKYSRLSTHNSLAISRRFTCEPCEGLTYCACRPMDFIQNAFLTFKYATSTMNTIIITWLIYNLNSIFQKGCIYRLAGLQLRI